MKNDDINITIDVISSQQDETPEEEFQFVSKEFTETAILYSMTGHIFISGTAIAVSITIAIRKKK